MINTELQGVRVRNRWEEESIDRYTNEVINAIAQTKEEIASHQEISDAARSMRHKERERERESTYMQYVLFRGS
jgi:hypothetical protein